MLTGMWIVLAALVLLVVGSYGAAGKQYAEFIAGHTGKFQLTFMAPASLYLLDKTGLMERISRTVNKIHHKIVALYGSKAGWNYTRMFIAQLLSAFLLLLIIAVLLGIASEGNLTLVAVGILLAVLTPPLMVRDLDKQIRVRKQDMLLELPEFLNKITLLVNAGETVQKAMMHCVDQGKPPEISPLYAELREVANQLRNNYSFALALEELSKRCAVQEVTVFTTTVLLNYRRGGDEFVIALQQLSRNLWEKRKAISRTMGEEASSKLVFPMVMIFLVVMVVVAAPAIMMMK
ncbi:type II secretion system F family protein [Paenibacillus athensensis]|uniref:Type II secretion system protein GspF domain-containing protein n=1 Tax=Paenibacillus athensensis TaxID=1967502 RepID=A0A4Y8Q9M2_9BACL|nr:type II secretion system F family protein [Paenibacillus athensensis]MCD1260378.1 type II secretion system F family protein [Paenibacillus athensensis]